MARSRNIKPGLFKNEVLGTSDPYLTILFTGLWCLADREGRLEDRPLRINAEIFPYRGFTLSDINGYLTQLVALGFIWRYEVDGVPLIEVCKFGKHQSPHSTEKPSDLPPKPQDYQQVTEAPLNNASITVKERKRNALIPDSLNTDSLNTKSSKDDVGIVFQAWQKELSHTKAKCDPKRTKIIKARMGEGFSVDDLLLVPVGVKRSPWHMGDNPTKTKYDGIETIFQSAAHVEKFMDLARSNGTGSSMGCDICMNHPNRHVLTVKAGGYIFDSDIDQVRMCVCNPQRNGTAQG